MNKKILFGIVIALAAVVLTVVVLSGKTDVNMEIDNRDDGSISVMVDKAGKGSGGIGYITIAEGQKLRVNADLTKKSSITIKVKPEDTNTFQGLMSDETETIMNTFQNVTSDDETVIMEETFTGVDNREFALPAGDYILLITAGKNATGNMEITAG